MDDKRRYEFHGQPDKCIICGSLLKVKVWPTAKGTTTYTVRCPKYRANSNDFDHDYYRWIEDNEKNLLQ